MGVTLSLVIKCPPFYADAEIPCNVPHKRVEAILVDTEFFILSRTLQFCLESYFLSECAFDNYALCPVKGAFMHFMKLHSDEK